MAENERNFCLPAEIIDGIFVAVETERENLITYHKTLINFLEQKNLSYDKKLEAKQFQLEIDFWKKILKAVGDIPVC